MVTPLNSTLTFVQTERLSSSEFKMQCHSMGWCIGKCPSEVPLFRVPFIGGRYHYSNQGSFDHSLQVLHHLTSGCSHHSRLLDSCLAMSSWFLESPVLAFSWGVRRNSAVLMYWYSGSAKDRHNVVKQPLHVYMCSKAF